MVFFIFDHCSLRRCHDYFLHQAYRCTASAGAGHIGCSALGNGFGRDSHWTAADLRTYFCFLAIENGAGFAVETARGALAGTVALAVFTCVYAAVCPKGWLKASFLSVALYVLASWIAAELPISAVTLAVAAAAAIILSLWIMPVPHGAAVKHRPPKHDLLMRMGMMMVLMIAITFLAPYIGPTASGIASTFPYMALTMAVFSQIQGGPDDARRAMHGLMLGMYSGLAFNAVVWTLAAEDRLLIAYAAATAAALAAQGVVLALTLKKTP